MLVFRPHIFVSVLSRVRHVLCCAAPTHQPSPPHHTLAVCVCATEHKRSSRVSCLLAYTLLHAQRVQCGRAASRGVYPSRQESLHTPCTHAALPGHSLSTTQVETGLHNVEHELTLSTGAGYVRGVDGRQHTVMLGPRMYTSLSHSPLPLGWDVAEAPDVGALIESAAYCLKLLPLDACPLMVIATDGTCVLRRRWIVAMII